MFSCGDDRVNHRLDVSGINEFDRCRKGAHRKFGYKKRSASNEIDISYRGLKIGTFYLTSFLTNRKVMKLV
jgi:hypothetical protein